MTWFGPGREDVWKALSEQLGAKFVAGGLWGGDKVQAHVGPWTITLDRYDVPTEASVLSFTRMRAPFHNPSDFRFSIYRQGPLSRIRKILGMQDIEVGHKDFDDAFIIKGNEEGRVRALFQDAAIRELLMAQPQASLEIRNDEGWFDTPLPHDVDELVFEVAEEISDLSRLRGLFDLFSELLEQLCRIGACDRQDPGVSL